MATTFGALRRRLLAPSLASVGFAGRGFPVTHTAATERLEMIPQSVVCGFEWAIDGSGQWEVERRLAMLEPELRGFGYEGATMACTVLDAMPGRGGRTRKLLLGPGQPHIFLCYIGIGFAMARLPRVLWKHVLPDLSGTPFHPTMSWLAVDGYGFDLAYFHPRRWVHEQRLPEPYPWQGSPGYFRRAFDQGIGRALWFMHGADAAEVADAVARFAPDRHADLWSGAGLAATFAGGSSSAGLGALRSSAGEYAADLAVGVIFAVKARSYAAKSLGAGLPPHTELALDLLTGLSVADAIALADRTEVGEEEGSENTPAYELWRQRIRARFA